MFRVIIQSALQDLEKYISIQHRALSRRTFAEGMLKSAEFACKERKRILSFRMLCLKNKFGKLFCNYVNSNS